jgi:predicted NBD/HSP70 family sugar kinase
MGWYAVFVRPLPVRPFEPDALELVLDLVRCGAAETRQDLVRVSGLGRAVVVDRVDRLIAHGLLTEEGLGPSTGGRPSRRIAFRSDAGMLLIAVLGTTSFGVGLADLAGSLRIAHHEPLDDPNDPERTLDRLEELFDWLMDEGHARGRLWGMTIGLPGPVEAPARRLVGTARPRVSPAWDVYPIQTRLAARYGAPAWLENDVHLMALGELRTGIGPDTADLLFVNVGSAVGAGLCVAGQLHRGAQGSAGAIGHARVAEPTDVVCRCGKVGCLDALAGGAAIARAGARLAESGLSRALSEVLANAGSIVAADVAIAAAQGDHACVELLQGAGSLIGIAAAGLVDSFNPEVLVLGGPVVQAGDLFLASVREAVYGHSYPLATRDLRIVRSVMGQSAGLVGGAHAIVERVFAPEVLRSWLEAGSPLGHPEIAATLVANRSQAGTKRHDAASSGPGQPSSANPGSPVVAANEMI